VAGSIDIEKWKEKKEREYINRQYCIYARAKTAWQKRKLGKEGSAF
jgi:hypothetical protein